MTATVTIKDNPPKPKVSIADASATEGSAVAFTVSVSPTYAQAMTLTYQTADGTATTADADYTGTSSGSLTIPANTASASFSVATGNDAKDEADETFTVTLSGTPADVDLTRATATGTINDNDDPAPPPPRSSVSIADASATEGSAVSFTVSVSPTHAQPITLSYATADGTATTADGDYTSTSGSVTIPANAPSASFSVATGNDAKDEPNETFSVTLSGAPSGVDITRATATGTINDNDEPPTPVVSIAGGSAITEGGVAVFTLSATPAPPSSITVNVNVTQTGSFATSGQTGTKQVTIGTGGTGSLTVSTQDDNTDEPNGSITARVNTGTNYVPATNNTATVNVNDNDEPPTPVVSIASGSTITEGGTATFTLSATPKPAASITVNVNVTQTGDFAANGQTGTRQVTLGTSGSASLTVATVNDNTDEASGSITATVNTGNKYSPSSTHGSATVNVNDNDEPPPQTPVVSITGGSTITEGGTATFTLSATPKPAASITVDVHVTQTGDFAANGQTGTKQVTIGTGGTGSLTVATVNDDADEASGAITATISTGSGYSPSGTHGSATVNVNDNDEPPPQTPIVSIDGSSTITEGGVAVFTLSATPAPPASITVNVNVTQTGNFAASGQTGSRQMTLGTGGTTSLTVSTQDDNTDEAHGAITATISSGSGYSPSGTNGSATVAVNDNDEPTTATAGNTGSGAGVNPETAPESTVNPETAPESEVNPETDSTPVQPNPPESTPASGGPTLSIADTKVVEGATAQFEVRLSAPTSQVVFVDCIAIEGTAQSNVDFSVMDVTIHIPADSIRVVIEVQILEDALYEGTEFFAMRLSNARGATLGQSEAEGIIIDNDNPPRLTIADATVAEGAEAVLIVRLSGVSSREVEVDWRIEAQTATEGIDYELPTAPGAETRRDFSNFFASFFQQSPDSTALPVIDRGTLSIPAGQTMAPLAVQTLQDTLAEADETFQVILSKPSQATLAEDEVAATVTITTATAAADATTDTLTTDSAPALPSLTIADTTVTEGAIAVFVVQLSAATDQPVVVEWHIEEGTATAGSDYRIFTLTDLLESGITSLTMSEFMAVSPDSNTLTIAAGQTRALLAVRILQDTVAEGDETFQMILANPTQATLAKAAATGTILDDDEP